MNKRLRLTDWLTDIEAVQCVANERPTTHIILFAVDVHSTHASNQTTTDASSVADQRVVTVATHVEVLAEVNAAEFSLHDQFAD